LKIYILALKLNMEIGNKKGVTKNYNNIGIVYFYQGDYTKAITYCFESLKIAKEIGEKKVMANDYRDIGNCYWRLGDYSDALTNQLASQKINEEIGDKNGIAENYKDIGLIYYEQGNFDEALENENNALKINNELKDTNAIAMVYTNFGIIYEGQRNYPKALKSHLASLNISEKLGDKNGIISNYTNIGTVYYEQGDYSNALKNYFEALKIAEELNGKEEIGNTYNNIGRVYTKQKKIKEGYEYLNKALAISKETGRKNRIQENYEALALLDSVDGNWKDAYNHHKLFLLYRDSLINEKNTKKLVQSQMQYDFEKKEATTKAEQDRKNTIAKEEKQRQRIITIAVSIGLIIVLIFSVLLLKRFRITIKQKRVIEMQKKMVEKQKELVEEKNKQVTDSITYAKRIQTAILPSERIVKDALENSFILYIPKDIVAGDFYWIEKVQISDSKFQISNSANQSEISNLKSEIVLFAACDCTGHGVSGAMVSVVCNNALNRAVREFGLIEPALILNKVAEIVIESFAKSEAEIMDGMDASLCAYNPVTKVLQWAGAFNPFWIVRNGELIETKGDKQPIGGKYQVKQPFTNHIFQMNDGDSIYLFSDGFADQFGGETGKKKLTRKRFKDLILSIQDTPIQQQGKELEDFYYDYKKDLEQIDDILVMGVRV